MKSWSSFERHNYYQNHVPCIYFAEYRQRGRFAGFSLYVSTTGDIQGSILCYKDGPQLPPLNFTTTCIQHGRYVIFYNERKDRVIYPKDYQLTNVFNELCEVVILGICISPVLSSLCPFVYFFFYKCFCFKFYAVIPSLLNFTNHCKERMTLRSFESRCLWIGNTDTYMNVSKLVVKKYHVI